MELLIKLENLLNVRMEKKLNYHLIYHNNIDLDLDGLKDSVFSELLKFQGNAIRRDDITYLSFQP